jgi:uncharacterized protein YjgD (DUF1641 family)
VSFREVFRQKYGHLGIIINGIEQSMRLSSVLKKKGILNTYTKGKAGVIARETQSSLQKTTTNRII